MRSANKSDLNNLTDGIAFNMPFLSIRIGLICALVALSLSDKGHSRGKRPLLSNSNTTSFYDDNPTFHAPVNPIKEWGTAIPEEVGMQTARLEAASTALEAFPHSLSLLIFRRGKLAWERYFHGSGPNHSNNVHSASKSILSALVGIAIERGFLKNVNEKIEGYLAPPFLLKGAKSQLRIRDLLTMSAGLKWTEDKTEYEIEDKSNWVQAILDLPQANPIGREFNYSTGVSHLLSVVLSTSTGMDTATFAKKHLFEPLNISYQRWARDPQGFYSGGWNLYLRPRELAKIAQLFLQAGNWNGKQIISSQWIRDSWTPNYKVDSTYHYGYLWWIRAFGKYEVPFMWGYGGQFAYVVPNLDLIVVMTTDTKTDHPELDGDAILSQHILPAVRE